MHGGSRYPLTSPTYLCFAISSEFGILSGYRKGSGCPISGFHSGDTVVWAGVLSGICGSGVSMNVGCF